jgi:hypothetical protein
VPLRASRTSCGHRWPRVRTQSGGRAVETTEGPS